MAQSHSKLFKQVADDVRKSLGLSPYLEPTYCAIVKHLISDTAYVNSFLTFVESNMIVSQRRRY